ncbi:MAG TPA: hypothetical protein VHS75_13695, partial [Phenylobacterium sp.]|nr:hypothetical protein [Phenylobacterium sp.]
LYFASAGSIVAFAELFRARARMLVRGQAALQASEARLELATKAAAVGVWEWRLLTNEMIYSPEAKAICGFPADEPVTYEMVAAVTHPAQRPSLKEMALSERTAVLRLLDLGSIRRSCGPGPGSRRDGRDVRPDKAPIHVRRRRRNVRFAPSFQHPLIPISKADGV